MAKINTYDYLSIHTHLIYFIVEHYRPYKKRPKIRCYMEIMQQRVFGRNSLLKIFNTYPSQAYEYSWHPVINLSVFTSH